jgi:hypothetical protein
MLAVKRNALLKIIALECIKKIPKLNQPSDVQAGKSGDTGGWEMGSAEEGVSGMGRTATRPDACLYFAMTVNLASI